MGSPCGDTCDRPGHLFKHFTDEQARRSERVLFPASQLPSGIGGASAALPDPAARLREASLGGHAPFSELSGWVCLPNSLFLNR